MLLDNDKLRGIKISLYKKFFNRKLLLVKSFARRYSANLNWQYLDGAFVVIAGLSEQLSIDNQNDFNLIGDDVFNNWLNNSINLASKSKQNLLVSVDASVSSSGLIELLKSLLNATDFQTDNTEQNNQINSKPSDFIISVLSITELDEATLAVVIDNIPDVNPLFDVKSFATEPIVLLGIAVSGRLDLSDIGFFSALQDFLPYLTVTAPVGVDVSEGAALVSARALANTYSSSSSLAVVSIPDLLPVGISYDSNTSTFSFNPNHSAYNGLAAGQVLAVSVAYTVSDGRINADALVIFKVIGTNDLASISGSSSAALSETDLALTANGTLLVTDSDWGEAKFIPKTNLPGSNGFGLFTINAAGQWIYNADAHNELTAGQVITDSVIVATVDGTASQVITVIINGSNDAPMVSSVAIAAQGIVIEAGNNDDGSVVAGTTTATGILTSSDADAVHTSSWSIQGATAGSYGTIAITAYGAWTYILNNSLASTQGLQEGQTSHESFVARVTDDQGDYADQIIIVDVIGTNDTPVLSLTTGSDQAALVEDGVTQLAEGQFTASDIDLNTLFTWSVVQPVGDYGELSVDQNGQWTYHLNNGYDHDANNPVQALVAGEQVQDTFTVRVADQYGADDQHQVTIRITGINDSAVITGDIAAQVVTDSFSDQLTTSGTLFADDADQGEVGFKADTCSGQFGSLAIDENGVWTYSVDNYLSVIQQLGEGDSIDDVFTIQSIDGTQQTVTISIFGMNDPAVISTSAFGETNQGSVTEVSNPVATGHLGITDVDLGQASFIAQSAIDGLYGVFGLDENGNWRYTLDSDNADVKHLGVYETLNDFFTVMSFDGLATETITITINGVDDALILQGPSYNLVISSAAAEQSNAIDTGSDLFQHFFLVDGEAVTDIETSWFYDQQQVTHYGILYLNSDTGGYKFVADIDAIQNLTTIKLALAKVEISNNGEMHPSNLVITLTNNATKIDSAGVVTLTNLADGDLIDLSALSTLYDIGDIDFYYDELQANNYLDIADLPVFDVEDIAQLQVWIDDYAYDVSI